MPQVGEIMVNIGSMYIQVLCYTPSLVFFYIKNTNEGELFCIGNTNVVDGVLPV